MSVFGDIGNFLWGGNDAASQAGNYYNQIPDILKQYLKPYVDRGNAVFPQLQGQYDQLLNHPGDLLNKLGQGYQQSPGYQFQLNQALSAGNRASAAKGMLGSPMQQQQAQQTASQFTNQLQNY
ncbi:hypothetical protein [Rickettsiella endosymbiont of Rhagonycha lignosa]|uniref:hypothetical protein n=1 Tax=Rickettsiella endosymbiont of Rhagonycha lignosa TaxID=3077937 RepID=UPI00313C3723